MTPLAIILFTLAVITAAVLWECRQLRKLMLLCFLCGLLFNVHTAEPKLNISNRGTNIVVFITGGTNTTQYWVRTSNDYTLTSPNWYDWKRLYPGVEALVYDPTYSTNTAASKPMRFFKLGAALPD